VKQALKVLRVIKVHKGLLVPRENKVHKEKQALKVLKDIKEPKVLSVLRAR
jgi:hypothetical protein